MPLDPIRSRSNPIVKLAREVRARRRDDLVLLEGERLVTEALGLGLAVEALVLREDLEAPAGLAEHPALRLASAEVLDAMSALDHGPGVLALVAAPPLLALESYAPPAGDSLLLCVSGVADPGNLGALARSAEAAGARAIAVAPGGAQPFGDKALRGSMGALLRLPVHTLDGVQSLARSGVRSVVAATRGGRDFRSYDWRGAVALWVTGETGRAQVEPPADAELVTIPMAGATESLNAACAATLLLFESTRRKTWGTT
jgi:RNA methyltransferase, TrmH family